MQVPTAIGVPTVPQVPGPAQVPTAAQVPTVTQAPTAAQFPTAAQAPAPVQVPTTAQVPTVVQVPTDQEDLDNDTEMWNMYMDEVNEEDSRFTDAWKEDAGSIVVFVSLNPLIPVFVSQ